MVCPFKLCEMRALVATSDEWNRSTQCPICYPKIHTVNSRSNEKVSAGSIHERMPVENSIENLELGARYVKPGLATVKCSPNRRKIAQGRLNLGNLPSL
jgi:hypothetical protein